MRKLEIGQAVRVEHNAVIVGQPDKDNPYWYEVEYGDGSRAVVALSRINTVIDRARLVIDDDGSIQIFSPRLSAAGVLDLIEHLRLHEREFQAAAGIEPECTDVSTIVYRSPNET